MPEFRFSRFGTMVASFVALHVVVITVFTGVASDKLDDCDSTKAINCLTSLAESTEKEALFFPDTPQKLRNYCQHLIKGLECANLIIEKCSDEEGKQIYKNLTADMVDMNEALCTEGSPMSTRFLSHVDCYKRHSDKFNFCSNRYIGNIVVVRGLSSDKQVKMTCCTVHEYSHCMRKVVSTVDEVCDEDADKLVEETVEKTMRSSLKYCNMIDNVPTRDCRKKFTPNPSQSSSSNGLSDYEDEESDTACIARISQFLLMIVLLRHMLFR